MADDPHRDLLPVKEVSCVNTCRSSVIDPRERHAVCKLDRYELEDRYLRLLDEVQDLKKLSNTQEDKIKRLATKLMRVAATPRSCLPTTLDLNNDRNRLECLEHENAKLKDKITVLRNQILNHKIGRSRSRNQRLQNYSSSGPTTFRSEIGRVKSSSSHLIHDLEDDKDGRNYLARIEDLEMQKKEMTSRIEELESQIENHEVGKQREKAAENVEFIRVWRQMKQQNEQLVSARAINVSLTEQIRDLKELLEEKTRNNKEIAVALMTEKKKLSAMDGQLERTKNSELSLRDKDERIKDLTSEMSILHQHNDELIAISARYSKVERENVELKKKISEQLSDNRSLKVASANERANIMALQSANGQLMGKLHELQRNIDGLTIQLKAFQCQNERRERSESEHRMVRTINRETNTGLSLDENLEPSTKNVDREMEICKNCCRRSPEKATKLESKITSNRETQTDDDDFANSRNVRRDEIEKKSPKRIISESPVRGDRSFQPENGSACLMPEEMLKLLEQAQISSPMDVKNGVRTRRIASALSTEYSNQTESNHRQREHTVERSGFVNSENCITRTRRRSNDMPKTKRCDCGKDETCNENRDCGYSCARSISTRDNVDNDEIFKRRKRDLARDSFGNVVGDIGTCIQKTFDSIHMSRILRDDGIVGECNKSWRTSSSMINSTSGSSNDKDFVICGNKRTMDSSNSKKSKELPTIMENNSNFQRTVEDSSLNRCAKNCRGGEILWNCRCHVESSNDRSRRPTNSMRHTKNVANETSAFETEYSESSKDLVETTQMFDENIFDVASVRHGSKTSGLSRCEKVPEITGVDVKTKNNESQRESGVDSFLSTSMDRSDSSVIRAMDDEDGTSGDVRHAGKERRIGSTEKSIDESKVKSRNDDATRVTKESESVVEFNSFIKNKTILSPRESSSSVQDLGTVFSDENWHEYKRRSMANRAKFSRPSISTTDDRTRASNIFSDESYINNNAVVIRIESLSLNRECPLLEDPEIHQLYVEFSFLGYHGVKLETKSVPKPIGNETAYFNYMRKFEIDEDQHQMQRSIMRAMMTDDDNPNVKFIVVSEPLPNETETKDCAEVGYAFLNIRDHVLNEAPNEVSLTITNVKQTKPIGILKITLLGAEAIRRCMDL